MFLFASSAQVLADEAADFEALLDEAWEWRLAENPVFASRLGDRRKNDQWTDNSIGAIEQRNEQRRDFLRRLRAIDSSALSETNKLKLRPVSS